MVYVSPDLKTITNEAIEGYFEVDADITTFNIGDYKIVDGSLVYITDEDYEAEQSINREELLFNEIQSEISKKMDEAKALLASKFDVPADQIARYEAKYQLALECREKGDYSPFDFEAEIQGTTSEDLASSIIEMGDAWHSTINTIYSKLDGLRIKLEGYIATKTDEEFESIFNSVDALDVLNFTDDDLRAI